MTSGLIEFDHESKHCSKVNTCLPSILFSNVKAIKNYDQFENAMMNIVVGAYGFGCV